MVAETFYCPYCKTQLIKSDAAFVLGELQNSKSSSYIMMGGMAKSITCPACRREIDAAKMVAGDYDPPASSGAAATVGGFVVVAVVIIVIYLLATS